MHNGKEYGHIKTKGFFMLGKIRGQMRKEREAGKNHKRILDLWKDTDSGLPEVDDAK